MCLSGPPGRAPGSADYSRPLRGSYGHGPIDAGRGARAPAISQLMGDWPGYMNVTNNARSLWLTFIALSFFWGSSYLFIKLGVDAGFTPFTLVAGRLLIGSILLGAVLRLSHETLPRDPRVYARIALLAVFAIALPFVLITIAEQHVPSALAATLTAPIPLFTIPFAALLLHERITSAKIAGIVVGLIGVAVLMGFDISQIGQADLTYQLVLVAAAVSYGLGGVLARMFTRGMRPMVPAFIEVASAMVMVGIAALIFENPVSEFANVGSQGLFAVAWLGVFGSGLAYLAFFRLIPVWGPTRTALVAYLLPIWGIALGFLVLNEAIQSGLILGTALVIVGIAFVNLDRDSVASGVKRLLTRSARPPAEAIPDAVIPPR
jgi:drug/metabolite transporter (DMT)-like permease